MRRESGHEVFRRVEQKMTHYDIGGFAAWNHAVEALFQAETPAWVVWVKDTDLYHGFSEVVELIPYAAPNAGASARRIW
ncbi:hypothetical protein [Methylomicrobium sp. Wu6]|uniref:hypothetical protein n=1 Tax=Methylomicrobium sp. Wu6 TaxID=3107928 RepID=UPI002DD670DE|nr:hypothetical protein [Methylomicrobium sp. Wu6]